MDGTVSHVMHFREGERSAADQRVVTIVDHSRSIFIVRGTDREYLEIGSQYEMAVGSEIYLVEAVEADDIGISRVSLEESYLLVVEGDQSLLSSRSAGVVHIVFEEVTDTLYVPTVAVKKANARTFMFILEDGLRIIRDIEIGLEGNTHTEILGGAEEGEHAIIE